MKIKFLNSIFFNIFSLYDRMFGSIINTNKTLRQFILCFFDCLLINIGLYLTIFFIENGELISSNLTNLLASILGILIYTLTGQYKELTKYIRISSLSSVNIILRNTFLIFLVSVFSYLFNLNNMNTKFFIQYWFILNLLITTSKLFLSDLLLSYLRRNKNKKNLIIYGANSSAFEIAMYIMNSKSYKIICFLEDNKVFWGRNICGIPIYNPNKIEEMHKKADEILIAFSKITSEKKYFLINKLSKYGLPLKLVPSMDQISAGKIRIDHAKKLEPKDLLFRKTKSSKQEISKNFIENEVVCITGAGGSIGTELCRQIIELKPIKLVIIEVSEHSLWKLEKQIKDLVKNSVIIKPVLANLNDIKLIKNILIDEKVGIIFHAAAYKHVPLVELNPFEGIRNNSFTTHALCEACRSSYIKNFLLISTDKAVRPTNLMGASKRLSEIILQYFHSRNEKNLLNEKIIFSSVRFGNVLGSSGSVVPIFQEQIQKGGPLTLTHKEITRFFMTISEAVNLVIQSIILARGGEVFLLDMGEPVPIVNLARLMIINSGLTIKDENNLEGDIEIIETGLRPGEKLYEETLIHGKSEKTSNNMIYKAEEKSNLPPRKIKELLEKLKINIDNSNLEETLKIMQELVPNWNRSKYL